MRQHIFENVARFARKHFWTSENCILAYSKLVGTPCIGTFCKPSSLRLQIFFSPSIEFDSTLSVLVRLNFFIFSAAFWRASIMSFLSSSVVRSSARTKSSARQIHSTYLNYKLQLPRHGIINYTLNSPFSNHFITVPTLNHQKPRLLLAVRRDTVRMNPFRTYPFICKSICIWIIIS